VWSDPQVFVFAPAFAAPEAPLPLGERMDDVRVCNLSSFEDAGEHDIFVKFLAGEEVRQSLTCA